jgi:hypothetical protein
VSRSFDATQAARPLPLRPLVPEERDPDPAVVARWLACVVRVTAEAEFASLPTATR